MSSLVATPAQPTAQPPTAPRVEADYHHVATRDQYPRHFPQQLVLLTREVESMVHQYQVYGFRGQRDGSAIGNGSVTCTNLRMGAEGKPVAHGTFVMQDQFTAAELQQLVTETTLEKFIDYRLLLGQQVLPQGGGIPVTERLPVKRICLGFIGDGFHGRIVARTSPSMNHQRLPTRR